MPRPSPLLRIKAVARWLQWKHPRYPIMRRQLLPLIIYILAAWSITLPDLPAMAIGMPAMAIIFWFEPVIFGWIKKE